MDYDDIFDAFYSLYRAEADIPGSSDDEYKIGMRLANEAIRRWSRYDGTYWKELFTTLQNADDGDKVVTTGTDYAAPTDMKEAGGFVRLKNNGTTVRRYRIIEPQDAQFRDDNAFYCYFTGDPNNGFTLHLNPAPDTTVVGYDIDYVYYKQPTLFTTGTDVPEMSEPYFIVHRMLANRFRSSRNPYYQSAKSDAEDALKTMQADNNSGNWADPWQMADNSGSEWGASSGPTTFGG